MSGTSFVPEHVHANPADSSREESLVRAVRFEWNKFSTLRTN